MHTAWARTPAYQSPHRADALLNQLLKQAERDGSLRPDSRAFAAAIRAWGRSKRFEQKSVQALKLLRQMKELAPKYPSVKPTLEAYLAALDACARTHSVTVEQQMAALKVAFAIFKSISHDGLQPNASIFATVLKATSSLMSNSDERNAIAKAVFEKAVAAGQVDVSVVKSLQKASSSNLQHELLAPMSDQHGAILYGNIPPAWSKNVRLS